MLLILIARAPVDARQTAAQAARRASRRIRVRARTHARRLPLAIEQKADFVEQDLAVTKDGVLVCIHDLTLERTTNVEEVFPIAFVEDKTGAAPVKRWRVADFTLAEMKQLDAGSWFGAKFAGARIPTFQEAIDAVGTRRDSIPS